jgi:hypothetical protein
MTRTYNTTVDIKDMINKILHWFHNKELKQVQLLPQDIWLWTWYCKRCNTYESL